MKVHDNEDVAADAAFLATGGEMISSAATEDLARSNAMRLECAELISESSLHLRLTEKSSSTAVVKWNTLARNYVEQVQRSIASLPPATLSPSSSQEDDLLVSDRKSAQVLFGGGGTLNTCLVGTVSFLDGRMLKRTANAFVVPTIDLAVLMPPPSSSNPSSFLLPKDYLNYRYMDKRNLLARHIAKCLSKKKNRFGTVELSYYNGDTRRLVVMLSPPTTDSKSYFRVRLLLGTSRLAFPRSVFLPNRNNIRYAKMTNAASTDAVTEQQPTPYYNNALAEDGMHLMIVSTIQETSQKTSFFQEASVLIQVWAAQRGMLYGHDTIGSTGFMLLLTYLYRSKKITPRQSPWHAFVAMIKLLSETDFVGEGDSCNRKNNDTVAQNIGYQGLKLNYGRAKNKRQAIFMPATNDNSNITNKDEDELEQPLDVEEDCIPLHQGYGCDAIFLDSTGVLNYFAHVSASAMREVRWEAQTSLQIIRDSKYQHGSSTSVIGHSDSAFRRLFFVQCRFWRKHDLYIRVPFHSFRSSISTFSTTSSMQNVQSGDRQLDEHWKMKCFDLGLYEATTRTAVEFVTAALGDRATLVRPLTCGNGEYVDGHPVKLGVPTTNVGPDSATYCALHDTDQALTWTSVHVPTGPENTLLNKRKGISLSCPLRWHGGNPFLILGLRINSENSTRVVDRGPPADEKDSIQSKEFKAFWGNKAELRRFKDGAIVHAVVWNTLDEEQSFQGEKSKQGDSGKKPAFSFCTPGISNDIVERIVKYIFRTHLLCSNKDSDKVSTSTQLLMDGIKFLNTGILGLVESVETMPSVKHDTNNLSTVKSSIEMHRDVMKAFQELSAFLIDRTKDESNRLGDIPMSIDAVEPISPALRYSELFPPMKHPFFASNGDAKSKGQKITGVISSSVDPICIQIRLGRSNKWPSDLNAMGAAKCALLLRIAEGIEKEKTKAQCVVTPTHIDVGFGGYSFRLIVRPDEELRLIEGLRNPTPAAKELKMHLKKQYIVAESHHATVHAVHTRFPCAGTTVRLARRWVASHLLSGMFPIEAIELLIAKVFTDPAPLDTPGSVAAGFLRFLHLLSSHDFQKQPLIVDPQGHFTKADYDSIYEHFVGCRGDDLKNGPPMYLVSPNDRKDSNKSNMKRDGDAFAPTFTNVQPEHVILSRAVVLARKSFSYLLASMASGIEPEFGAVFQESPQSLRSFSLLLRVDPSIVVDSGCSSTGGNFSVSIDLNGQVETPFMKSFRNRISGPKALRKTIYKNLSASAGESVLHEWRPVDCLMESLRSKFGDKAVFFFNELTPDFIAVLWRPDTFKTHPLSALHSENKRPVENNWQNDSLVLTNQADILADMGHMCQDVVSEIKILDDRAVKNLPKETRKKRRTSRRLSAESSSSDDEESG